MIEDSVFRSQRELILNLQDHLNSVNEQKKAMKQRLDLTLRYQKSCQRELEITKQQLATTNSQVSDSKFLIFGDDVLTHAGERNLNFLGWQINCILKIHVCVVVKKFTFKSYFLISLFW